MLVPYTLTQEEVDEIVHIQMGVNKYFAANTLPEGRTIEEKAKDFWKRMGEKYKFKWDKVKMDGDKGARYILAEPSWKIL